MPEAKPFNDLSRDFQAAYATWTHAQKTGIDPLFLRIQLRKLSALIVQLEAADFDSGKPSMDKLWPKITEVKTALERFHSSRETTEASRQIAECMADIPELMLLELDQIMGTKITPEMLTGFDLNEDEPPQ